MLFHHNCHAQGILQQDWHNCKIKLFCYFLNSIVIQPPASDLHIKQDKRAILSVFFASFLDSIPKSLTIKTNLFCVLKYLSKQSLLAGKYQVQIFKQETGDFCLVCLASKSDMLTIPKDSDIRAVNYQCNGRYA